MREPKLSPPPKRGPWYWTKCYFKPGDKRLFRTRRWSGFEKEVYPCVVLKARASKTGRVRYEVVFTGGAAQRRGGIKITTLQVDLEDLLPPVCEVKRACERRAAS